MVIMAAATTDSDSKYKYNNSQQSSRHRYSKNSRRYRKFLIIHRTSTPAARFVRWRAVRSWGGICMRMCRTVDMLTRAVIVMVPVVL